MPAYPEHTGFLLAEDDALKLRLEEAVRLPDEKTGLPKPVKVWYRYPEAERQVIYPFITIELIGIEPAVDLWTSDYMISMMDPEVAEDPQTGHVTGHRIYDPSTSRSIPYDPSNPFFQRWNYLPYRLFYQLSCWSKSVMHDRMLSAQLIRDVIYPRPSWLYCPADGVWKRLETLGWVNADLPTQEGGSKRIFRKIFTISLQTDIPQDALADLELQNRIRRLSLRMFDRHDPNTFYTPSPETDHWETLWEHDDLPDPPTPIP